MQEKLTFAFPKGRILDQAIPILAAAGIDLRQAIDKAGRKLLFEVPDCRITAGAPTIAQIMLVKPVDVPTYVEHGIADLGIVGLDTLLEQDYDLYAPVDLGTGRCRLAIAEPADANRKLQQGMSLRVASKYPRSALRHYRKLGIQPDIIPLWGSIELAAISGLADQIVDIVESGETLRQNGLVEVETIAEITSRLIVNTASLHLKHSLISVFVTRVRAAVDARKLASSED